MKTKTIGILVATLFIAVSSEAAVFIVNSFNDAVDASIGNGVCATAAGECTLRAAIQEANFFNDSDTINLPSGLFLLTIDGADEDMAATGDLDILNTVTISGTGTATHINGNGAMVGDRIFEVHGGDVLIYSLKITNGRVDGNGGCIRNTADLVFETAEISDCYALGNSGFGGAVSSDNGGTLQMEFVTVNNNNAQISGGGISVSGFTQLYKVNFSENTASTGGAIRNTGNLELTRANVFNNDSSAILNLGDADIELTTFHGNSSNSSAGAISNLGSINMRNSTISGNSSTMTAGAIYDAGFGDVLLNNVTITSNTGSGTGGIDSPGTVELENTILASNVRTNGQASDCSGTLESAGHNLIRNFSGCNIIGNETGNIYNQDPLLSGLEDMGGPSLVHLLQHNSPAANAGNNASCEFSDQRELARPQFGSCDIGSVEARSEFTLHLLPDSLTTSPGQNAETTIEIASYFDFNSQVTLNCIGLPAGMSCSFNPNQVTPPANGIASSTLTINPGNNPEGTYTTNVVGVGGNSFQSKRLTLVISDRIYYDDFEDGDASDWSHNKGTWNVVAGKLTGTVDKKGDALSPDFGKCSECSMEADIRIDSADARVSLLAWVEDKKNLVEIRLMEDRDKVLLKQRKNGRTVAKKKALYEIDRGVTYNVRTYFDGYEIQVLIDDVLLFTVPAADIPNGNAGLRIKSMSGLPVSASFEQVTVD
jgi:CSLREA domain-containing protein